MESTCFDIFHHCGVSEEELAQLHILGNYLCISVVLVSFAVLH